MSRNGTASKPPVLLYVYFFLLLLPLQLQIGSLAMSPVRLMLLFMVVPLGIGLISGKYGKLLPVDWLFLIHVVWATLAVAYNSPSRAVESVGSMAVEFLGGYLIGRTQVRDKESFATYIKLMMFAIALTIPFAVAESLSGVRTFIGFFRSLGLPVMPEVLVEWRKGFARVQGPFDHPIHYGLFASMVVTLVFIGLKQQMAFFWRALCAALATFAVILSLSSGAILAVAIQAMLVGWSVATGWIRRKWALLFVLTALAYVTVDLLSNRSPVEVFMSRATFSPHTAYYRYATNQFAWANIMSNPIFGLGLRSWARPSWMYTGSIDNFWLVIGVRYGLPGLGLLICGYAYAVFKVGMATLQDPADLAIRRAWMITFGGLIFTLTTVHVWSVMYVHVFCFFGSGMWLVTAPSRAADMVEPASAPEARARGMRYSRFPAGAVTEEPQTADAPVGSQGQAAFGGQFRREGADAAAADATDEQRLPARRGRSEVKLSRFAANNGSGR